MIKKQPMAMLPAKPGYPVVVFDKDGHWACGEIAEDGTVQMEPLLDAFVPVAWVSEEDWKGAGHHV